jgi:CRP-like cAMP-binding protein/anti-anti-sigma regulatory factor
VVAALLLLAAYLAGAGALAYLPLAVLAGVMLSVAWALVDAWTRGLVRRLVRGTRDRSVLWSAAVVTVVTTVTVFGNFVVAVIVGLFLSMALFIASMHRSLVRAVHDGATRTSRRIYGPDDERRLAAARHRIKLIELEGALFFGSTERLGLEVEALAQTADHVVLDLRRVSAIDVTGAIVLEQLAKRLRAAKVNLLLAGVTPQGRHGAELAACGTFTDQAARLWFADADHALEWAERRLLGASDGAAAREIALEDLAFAAGLEPAEVEALRESLRRRELQAGEVLFREGEPGDRLFLLARGAVSIEVGGGASANRIVTFASGSLFGEAALLDGAARSATAIAAEDAVVYCLSRPALETLAARHPAIANKLLLNLGRHLSGRLRQTTDALRELSDSAG